ncbi:MAG: rhodanese-like domain-containing protein [Flavobacteriales bacterium]|nr:rhodanese-like domain-containing protein [Flavobacteriales bacterium]
MKEVTPKELYQLKESGADFELIDVREKDEYDMVNISGKLIPMGEVPERFSEIPKDKQVVVMCRSGKRSAHIVQYLETVQGYDKAYNLAGGILAYSDDVDPSLQKY